MTHLIIHGTKKAITFWETKWPLISIKPTHSWTSSSRVIASTGFMKFSSLIGKDHVDQNAQPYERESLSYSTILAACVYQTDEKCKACSHLNAYKFSIKNTTESRAQAFTTMSALHYRALLLSRLDCLYAKPGPR